MEQRFGTLITVEDWDREQDLAWEMEEVDPWYRIEVEELFDMKKAPGEDEVLIDMGFEPYVAFVNE